MADRIEFTRGEATNWFAQNPVLADGEPAVESDTHRIKVGDGVTAWRQLPYAALDEASYVSSRRLVISPVEPSNPTVGMIWIQTLS